jgi:hypothetical protein
MQVFDLNHFLSVYETRKRPEGRLLFLLMLVGSTDGIRRSEC